MALITVNLRLVSPQGTSDVPAPATGRVEFVPAAHGKYQNSLRTVERVPSTIDAEGVMVPVELTPDLWKVTITPSKGNPWPEMLFELTEGMEEPVNLADLLPHTVVNGKQLAKGDPGPTITSWEDNEDGTIKFLLSDGTYTDSGTMPRGPQGPAGPQGVEGPYGGTEVTDPQVASWIADPTTTTRDALARADLLGDRGEGLVTNLDHRRDAKIVVLGDSTGTPGHGEWPRRLGLDLGGRYPRTRVEYLLYSSATSAYGLPEVLSSGEVTTAPTVFHDDFSRTAGELIGTTPTVGGAWSGAANNYALDGSSAVWSPGGSATFVGAPVTMTGRLSTSADFEIVYDGTANTAGRVSLISAYVNGQKFLWITFTPGMDTVEFKVPASGGGTNVVHTATLADTGIALSPSPQPLTMSIEHVNNAVTFTCGGVSYTHTLTQSESDLLAAGTRVGFLTSFLPHKVLDIAATTTEDFPPLNAVTVYNGSVGSTLAWYPASRVLDMVPVRPDAVIFNFGHNHGAQTSEQFEASLDGTVAAIRAVYPGVPFIVGGQNPQYPPTTNLAAHHEREAHKREYARLRGFGYAPVLEAFMAQENPQAYLKADGVHPTADGADLWTGAVDGYLTSLSLAP